MTAAPCPPPRREKGKLKGILEEKKNEKRSRISQMRKRCAQLDRAHRGPSWQIKNTEQSKKLDFT